MRGRTIAATLILLLAACSSEAPQVETETSDPSTEGPTASPTATATATADPTMTPTQEPTPTPFGADVFEDPDSCEHSSGVYRVAFPDAWWWNTEYEHAELGELAACTYFAPDEFDITTASREDTVPQGVAISMQYLDDGCLGFFTPVLSSREVNIDGYTAVVEERAERPTEDSPPGGYGYRIDLNPDVPCEEGGQFITAGTGVDSAGDYEENKAMLDRMMSTMEISAP